MPACARSRKRGLEHTSSSPTQRSVHNIKLTVCVFLTNALMIRIPLCTWTEYLVLCAAKPLYAISTGATTLLCCGTIVQWLLECLPSVLGLIVLSADGCSGYVTSSIPMHSFEIAAIESVSTHHLTHEGLIGESIRQYYLRRLP